MGCVCSSLSSFISIVLDALERISLCTVCAMLTCCLLFTIITVLVLGIGIGYHYCYVQNSVESMGQAKNAPGGLRTAPGGQGHVMRSVDKAMQRGFAHRLARREADSPLANNNITHNSNFTNTDSLIVISNLPTIESTTQNATSFTVFRKLF